MPAPTPRSSPRRSARCRERSRDVLAAAGAGLRGHRRRLDQARGRRRDRRPALHRRPPAGRRRDRRRRARARGPVRRRDLVPDADRDDRGRAATSACTGCSRGSARGRRRSMPTTHDRLMAAVSHLPHVLANVLVAQAAGRWRRGERLPATGPSFRDATRVAGADRDLGATSTSPTRDALARRSTTRSRGSPRCATRWRRRRRRAGGLERRRARRAPARCSRPTSPAARCTSCASPCRTARASSPRSRSRSAARGVNIVDMALYPAAGQLAAARRAVDRRGPTPAAPRS